MPILTNLLIVYQPRMFGDIILGASGAKYLKKKFPNSKVIYITGMACLTNTNPYIDYSIQLRLPRRFEKAFATFLAFLPIKFFYLKHWLPEPHMFASFMKQLGLDYRDVEPQLYLTETDKAKAHQYISSKIYKNEKAKIIALQGDFGRKWNPEYFKELRASLSKEYNVIIIDDAMKLGRRKLNMREAAAVISLCDVFCGGISGNAHAAVAVKTSTVLTPNVFNPKWDMPEYYVSREEKKSIGCKHMTVLPSQENFCGSYKCVSVGKQYVSVSMGNYSAAHCDFGLPQSCVHSISTASVIEHIKNIIID